MLLAVKPGSKDIGIAIEVAKFDAMPEKVNSSEYAATRFCICVNQLDNRTAPDPEPKMIASLYGTKLPPILIFNCEVLISNQGVPSRYSVGAELELCCDKSPIITNLIQSNLACPGSG